MALQNRDRNSHYGNCMEPHKMREWGPKMAANIEALIAEGKYPILFYRGMSGIAAATTIANFMTSNHGDDYAMAYVRKSNENSHGQKVELTKCRPNGKEVVWVFCDDFISSGKTVTETLRVICNYYNVLIPFNSVRYALALEPDRWDESFTLNTINDAMVNIRDYRRVDIIKKMRKRHNSMLQKIRKKNAEREEQQRNMFAYLVDGTF